MVDYPLEIVSLRFVNRTSPTANAEMLVDKKKVHLVARWYGAYCAGDDYDILISGYRVPHDLNGEIIKQSE